MQTMTDKADALTLDCEKLRALARLFGIVYTTACLDEVQQTISANLEAFVAAFSIIEDMIEKVQQTAQELTDMLYTESHKQSE